MLRNRCLPLQVDWGKGRALAHMLVALGLEEAEDVVPIYLGDDRTDEDAFKVLKERSAGLGILISSKVRSTSCLGPPVGFRAKNGHSALHTQSPQFPVAVMSHSNISSR